METLIVGWHTGVYSGMFAEKVQRVVADRRGEGQWVCPEPGENPRTLVLIFSCKGMLLLCPQVVWLLIRCSKSYQDSFVKGH